jgi:hypothetical protein|tara:strand:+ start:285 stop:611 length:327 start_codon:yes stop_codon:yes gene_type:complete
MKANQIQVKNQNINEEKLYDSNLSKCIDELENILEDFTGKAKPGSRPGSLKRKAAQYLGKGAGDKLSQTDLKKLRAKANKMKKSTKKAERDRGIQLARQVSFAFNMRD